MWYDQSQNEAELARLMSCIDRTANCRQYCHVGHEGIGCRLGLFQGADFA